MANIPSAKATQTIDRSSLETKLFINGQTPARMSCYSPEDDTIVTDSVHKAVQDDVDASVSAARAAFSAWSNTPPSKRAEILVKFADLIEAHADQIALLEAVCTGKPLQVFHGFEKVLTTTVYRYYAGWCGKLGGESFPSNDGTGLLKIVHREPLGVCAAVISYNGPIGLMALKAAPCLAAGNTIIIKASEKTPLSSLYLGNLANEAGFPPGVINFISGDGETGGLLAAHMDIDKISFTGSVGVGKKIAQAAAQSNLKRVSLELGGKSPSIIFPDANMDVAIQWCVQGIVGLSGQACFASSRIYVHNDIKQQVIERMQAAFQQVDGQYGDAISETTLHPPMVDRAHFDRVSSFIESGKNEATLLTGGDQMFNKGCWIRPTIFTDPSPNATVHKEEIFGPVVVISGFSDEDEVDINRAMRVASKITTGTVCINCCATIDPSVPFGGRGQSGWGRELGKQGIDEYTEAKTVLINMMY
ncbi:hypothetical protein MW887_011877 [Aspergillus wentii]|nr:hypothetical protein MW887_011877 [Aspergillus wentii]